MSNILSAEMFKLRKEKVTGIVLLINIVLAVLFAVGMALIIQFFGEEMQTAFQDPEMAGMGMEGMDTLFAGYASNAPSDAFSMFYSQIAICIGVLAGFFICYEFETGTIRNTLSVGKSRTAYYVSKIITLFVAAIVLSIITTLIYLITMVAFFEFSIPDGYAVNLLLLIGGKAFIYLTYVTLFTALAFVFRGLAATLGIAIGFAMLIEPIAIMIFSTDAFSSVSVIRNIFPYHHVLQFNQVFNNGIDGELRTYLVSAAVCFAMIAVSTLIGIFTFNKRDVK